MRLSVCMPIFFEGLPIHEAIREADKLGFDAVEMWKMTDIDFEETKKALDETGVEFVAICTDYPKLTAEADLAPYLEGVKTACEKAKKLGIKRLISQVGYDTGEPREIQCARIVNGLKKAAEILEEYDITIIVEPLNTLVNHRGYFLWSSVEAFDILREVNHPLIKLCYDIYHQQVMEGNILANVLGNLDLIGHLHSAGCPGRHELQFGENDYKRIFEEVEKAGYTGSCALEYFPLLDPIESLKEAKRIYG